MYFLIFLTAVLLSFVSYSVPALLIDTSPIYGFYLLLIRTGLLNPVIAIGGFLLILWAVYARVKFGTEKTRTEKIILSARQAVMVVVIGGLMSLILVYFVAWAELNIVAMAMNGNPEVIGVRTDAGEISKLLTERGKMPEIVIRGESMTEPAAVAAVSGTKDSFFATQVVNTIPDFLVVRNKNNYGLMMAGNTLIIDEQDQNVLRGISPVLSYLMVKNIFPERTIKPVPKIIFAERDEYNRIRSEDVKDKQKKMDEELGSYTARVQDTREEIEIKRLVIPEREEELNRVYRGREEEYRKCLVDSKSEAVCKNEISAWDQEIIEANENIKISKNEVSETEQRLKEEEDFLKVIQAQKSVMKILEENIIREYGQFVPPEIIYLTREDLERRDVADYLETLVHEYLHYASFVSDKRVMADAFWEEGLTEYFARKAIYKGMGVNTNIGYPAAVKIINRMSRRVADTEWAQIYFDKDQPLLEETLDRVYGDNFYQNTRIYFTLVQYTAEPGQVLKYANEIMKKIGGDPLSIEDMMSERRPVGQ